jgi:hypothetical protein
MSKSTKKVIFEEHSQEVDYQTGELTNSKIVKIAKIDREPDYIKLYLKDISALKNIPKTNNEILYELFKLANYDTNLIVLNSYLKNMIADNLNIKFQTIQNAITKFVKEEILIRQGVGTYLLNPYLFGKGSWNNLKELRLTITYNSNGKNIEFEKVKDEVACDKVD